MTRVEQTTENSCGQACVAMLTGQPIEEVIKVIGHDNSTYSKDLVKALRHFDLKCADTLTPYTEDTILPIISIILVDHDVKVLRPLGSKVRGNHWAICCFGNIIDPDPIMENRLGLLPNERISAFLRIDIK
jgi:hypothetical protein